MKQPLVNNFRYVKKYEIFPPYLIDYKVILGYQAFHSSFNQQIYVVFDQSNNLYYAFEDEGSDDIDNSLGWCIKTYIINS